ncbi:MAG: DUF3168 domain-containing protein [Pseudomonadota bacterium]
MSYGAASALQQAVYQRLIADTALGNLVGAHIYDALPPGSLPALYVSLGPESVRDGSSASGGGARHEFVISIVADASGFQTAKDVAAAISDALVDAPLTLARGALIGLWFLRAKAARFDNDSARRIDLTFRAQVDGL